MMIRKPAGCRRCRSGKIALVTALLLTVLLGALACALDTGWITMTKTQLQAATDSGALAGGTELLSGLGPSAWRTPSEVEGASQEQAVELASRNRAGDEAAVFVDEARDVSLGTGYMDSGTGVWTFTWGATPYNAVRVLGRRDVAGSPNGDGPLPLFVAPVIGHEESNLDVLSTAVILPAGGIRIVPGSGEGSGLTPFAFERARWQKYWRAQAWFEDVLGSDPSLINSSIMDDGPDGDGEMLFFEYVQRGQGGGTGGNNNLVLQQIFNDAYSVEDPDNHDSATILNSPDGLLEFNLYPINSTEGNWGTVDIGGLDNSTQVLKRQIEFGPNEDDLSQYENHEINPNDDSPVTLQGDTGISAGIESTIIDILGQCRSILLYSEVDNPGNNAEYQIVDMVGTRWMHADFSGNDKLLVIQPCATIEPAGVPDFDSEIDEYTTLFTPLILAQ